MTTEELWNYRKLKEKLDSLERFRENQYYPYRSPSFSKIGSSPLSPGDPTAEAIRRIDERSGMIDDEIKKLRRRIDHIVDWVKAIDDPEISAIANYHYLQGMTWRDISMLMYSSNAKQTAYSIWNRWCKDHPEKLADDADFC